MKKMIIFMLSALIAINCVSAALAANWVRVGRNDEYIFFVDTSSLSQTEDTFKMLQKTTLRTTQIQDEHKKLLKFSQTPAYYVEYMEYMIDEPSFIRISLVYYTEDNTVINSFDGTKEWDMCPSGSIGEYEWHIGRKILGLE